MLVVLGMVAEKIAAHHCPDVIFLLGTRVVRSHLGGVRIAVRPEGTEIEELEGAEKCRNYPECDQIFQGYPQQIETDIEEQRHHQYLPCRYIAKEKLKKPEEKGLMLHGEIGIVCCSGIAVVGHMLRKHFLVRKGGKEPEGQLSRRIVKLSVSGYASVHAVVGRYEEAGIEVPLNCNMEIGQRISP